MPRRSRGPTHRTYLTLTALQYDVLSQLAHEAGSVPASIGAEILTSVLDAAVDQQGDIDRDQLQATVRALRGDPTYAATLPRWKRPLDAILLDTLWWKAWYPDLCRLLGPHPQPQGTSSALGAEGYCDPLEVLFPTIPSPRGPLTWRSPDYPIAAESRRKGEGSMPLRVVWESMIRHVVVALCALEKTQDPALLISVEAQIRHGWLGTLNSLAGEMERGKFTAPHPPQKSV